MRDMDKASDTATAYQRFFESAVDLLCIADLEGRLRLVNPSWQRVLGWSAAEMVGRPYLDFVHPEDVAATLEASSALARGERVERFTNRYRCKDGSWRWVEWCSVVTGGDGLIHATVRDVTDDRRAQVHLAEIEHVSRVGSWRLDVAQGEGYWSPVTRMIHEVPPDTPPPLEWGLAFYPPEARKTLADALERLRADGTPYDLELPFLTAKGRHRFVRTTGASEFDSGHVIRVFGTFQDITAAREERDRLLDFKDIVELADDGIWVIDHEGRTTYANARMATMLGCTPEEFAGTHFLDFVAEADRADAVAQFARRSAGLAERLEYRLLRRDGRPIWTSVSARPRMDAQGRMLSAIALVTDITAEREQREALAEAKARLEATLDALPDLLVEIDAGGKFVSVHASDPSLLLVPADEVIGRRLDEICGPEVAAIGQQAMAEAEATGRSTGWTYSLDLPQGRRWFELSATPRPAQSPAGRDGCLCLIRDITRRVEAEADAKYRRELLQAMFDLMPIGMALSDIETGQFVDGNPAFLVPLGHDRAALGSLHHSDVTPARHAATSAEAIRALRETGCYGPIEKELVRRDGTLYPVRLQGALVTDSHGRRLIASVIEDVTERKAHEAALIAAREQAEEANRLKSLFLANMSHEIRTPMNGVLGMAAVLDAALTDPEHRAMLAVIRESGTVLLNVINDILDLSKIEAGHLEFDAEPFDPVAIGDRLDRLYRRRAAEKGIAFSVTVAADGGTRRLGDAQRILQILHNLVGNALKFTERGAVSVDIGGHDCGPLTLTVRDSGIGMDAEQLSRVFDPFTQADSTVTRRFGGTGLGMSIVRRLVDTMDGEITMESTPGVGSCVSVSLPLATVPVAPGPAPDTEPVARPLAASLDIAVLAAEDNAVNRVVLEAMLSRLGVRCTMVEGGRDAVEAWRPGAFDALLLDISMPDMDGPTALAAIRAREAAAGADPLPAVAVTAHAMKHQVSGYLSGGFNAHVPKPIDLAQLESTLRALTARRARADGPVGG